MKNYMISQPRNYYEHNICNIQRKLCCYYVRDEVALRFAEILTSRYIDLIK